MVQLQLIPGIETDPSFLKFTYECIKFQSTYMEFQTSFNNTDQISIKESKEFIRVDFYGSEYFRTSTDETFG